MKSSENTTVSQDEDQADALEEFAPRVRELLVAYRDKRQFSSIAERIGIHATQLTEMISKKGDGTYKKENHGLLPCQIPGCRHHGCS